MKQPTNHTRWHYFDSTTGEKIIRRFPIDHNPGAPWQRGTGPHKPEVRKQIVDNLMKHVRGKPKSLEQKQKMRKAKLGVKKTPEHCKAISDAFARRRKEKQERIIEAYKIAQEATHEYYAQRLDRRAVDV